MNFDVRRAALVTSNSCLRESEPPPASIIPIFSPCLAISFHLGILSLLPAIASGANRLAMRGLPHPSVSRELAFRVLRVHRRLARIKREKVILGFNLASFNEAGKRNGR